MDQWTQTLEKARDCGAKHISIYDLQIEENTTFGRWYTPGVYPLPPEDTGAEMYKKAVEILSTPCSSAKESFEHYEVSNYAKKGYRSRHNQKYWSCSPVYGFGMAAASYINGERFVRPDNMRDYREFIGTKQRNPSDISDNLASVAPDIYEYIMLALRTSDGINLSEFKQLYGMRMYTSLLKSLSAFQHRGKSLYIGTYHHLPTNYISFYAFEPSVLYINTGFRNIQIRVHL